MKILDIVLKVLLRLILVTPILGLTGLFPPPTRDLYNTDQAFPLLRNVYFLWQQRRQYAPLMAATS